MSTEVEQVVTDVAVVDDVGGIEPPSSLALRKMVRERDETLDEILGSDEGTTDAIPLDPPYNIQYEWVTPKRAAYLLKQSASLFRNRPVSARTLQKLVGTMLRNEFRDTGDTVKVTDDGAVIDGQHRLMSIVLSGKAQALHIAYGVDPSIFRNIDQNYRRSFDQMLRMEGWTETLHRASIVRKGYFYTEYGRFDPPYAVAPTADQLYTFMHDHPDIHEALEDTQLLQRGVLWRTGVMGVLCWVFRSIHNEDAEYFINKLSTGDRLATDDPIYRLRERMIQAKTKTSVRFSDEELGALMILSWNAFRQGRRLSYLRWRGGGANPDPFPNPV